MMTSRIATKIIIAFFSLFWSIHLGFCQTRPRDLGVPFGILPIGALNAITDVPGVKV